MTQTNPKTTTARKHPRCQACHKYNARYVEQGTGLLVCTICYRKRSEAKPFVLSKHPDAYIREWRGSFQVARPRGESDKISTLAYVALSCMCKDEPLAWTDAAEMLGLNGKRP